MDYFSNVLKLVLSISAFLLLPADIALVSVLIALVAIVLSDSNSNNN